MLDPVEMTRALTDTGLKPEHAAAITHAVQRAAEREQYVTFDQFQAGLAELRADFAEHRSEQRTETAEVRTEMAQVRTEIAELRSEMSTEISRAEARIIKWVGGSCSPPLASSPRPA